MLQGQFICATEKYCTLYDHVNAPYIRKGFSVPAFQKAELYICGLGFYDAWINGRRITKGYLAPYISNPCHIAYYDRYDITDALHSGENAVGVILGNGFQNSIGGVAWGFDKADFRSSPKLCLTVVVDGKVLLNSDTSFRWAPSPITFDDLRCGEYYDARLEQKGWSEPGFDDSSWEPTLPAEPPTGELRLCQAEPVVCTREILPVSKRVSDGRFLLDFGVNTSGVCRVKYKGFPGERVTIWYAETLVGGTFYNRNTCVPDFDCNLWQKDVLICSGEEDIFESRFTYHGFRYVYIQGLCGKMEEDFITLRVLQSGFPNSGSFSCSDETVNGLQAITVNSDTTNFIWFPTDCPQREKNGWTADAALSAEQMLMNLDCANSMAVWLESVRKAQKEDGQLPGIVPTVEFGYTWGNGPAWDQVIVELPYQIYRFTGDKKLLLDNQEAIYRYMGYLQKKRQENGLLCFGLGDWCETGTFGEGDYATPLEVTDTLVSIELLKKSEFILTQTGEPEKAAECRAFWQELLGLFREKYVTEQCLVSCETQTAQAKAIHEGVFTEEEKPLAVKHLLSLIERDGGHFKVGVIGARVLFRVLAENGYAELAHRLITQDGFPSYKYWLDHGATTLWEGFNEVEEGSLLRKDGARMLSLNHHFWGDISAWFYRYILGLRVNPNGDDSNAFEVRPCEIPSISHAEGSYENKNGKITVSWHRDSTGKPVIHTETTGSFRVI